MRNLHPVKVGQCLLDGKHIYIKVANTSEQAQDISLNFTGLKKKENVKGVKRICLKSDKLYEDNSIDTPDNITPEEEPFDSEGQSFTVTIEPLSFCIYIISAE